MRLIALTLLGCIASCAHVQIDAGTGASVTSRTSITSTSVGLRATGAGAVAGVLIGATLASDSSELPPASPLAPDREVAEQDCTKPIELGANVRCK
jgi:hypothetical protein